VTFAATEPEVLELLRRSTLFGDIPDGELTGIASRLDAARFAAGDTIVREGDEGHSAFLIASGEAAVVAHDLIGEQVILTVFGPGATFGETALVDSSPRTATVIARTDVDAFVLDRATFEQIAKTTPAFAASVRRYVDMLSVDRILKKASPFARLSTERIRRLTAQLVPLRVTAGATVVREGDEGDRFYLIRSGRFEVLQGSRSMSELGPGEVFGEIALLTGGKRVATVRALDDGELLALSKADFDAVVGEDVGVRGQMNELGRVRFRATTGEPLALPDPVTTLMPYLDEKRRGRYWKLLVAGALLFAASSVAALRFDAPLAIFAVLVLGAFLTPVVYVVYLVESDVLATRPRSVVATFVLAALLGIPVASILEAFVFHFDGNTLGGAIGIAATEELLKLLGVAWLLGRSSARFRMDGVVFGAAAGMGFAAFETLLFGASNLDRLDALLKTVGLRSLLAPLGHGTWTAIVCATIWSERNRGRLVGPGVLGAFALATGLHALWDWQPLAIAFPAYALPADLVWFLAIGALGILALRAIVHRATTEELSSIIALNPELASPRRGDAPRIACRRCGQIAPAGAHYCVRCGAVLRATVTP
jgi:CRP-like cAMP-binding protein